MVLTRGLGNNYILKKRKTPDGEVVVEDDGHYKFCLTDKRVTVVKHMDGEPAAEFPLTCIRSCGSLKKYFYLELGRSSTVGPGELWLETEDANIAQNIHQTVFQ